MPKHLIKRFAPSHETIRNHKHLRIFGKLLQDPNLWHMNRRSISGAFAVGLFWALIPMPMQMLAAAATAIPARINLPISVALVWITNPLTMPPIFYFNYLVGTWVMGEAPPGNKFELTLEWFTESMKMIWQPLYLGSLICAVIAAVLGYATMRGIWRLYVVNQLKQKRKKKTHLHDC